MNSESEPESGDSSAQIGKWMIIAMWVMVLGFGTLFAQRWLDKRDLGQIPANFTDIDGRSNIQLEADRLGHYVVSGMINGSQVTFLVDTGASGVSIPAGIADDLGLTPGATYPAMTANGVVMVRETILDSLSIGDLRREDVQASINPGMDGNVALLGMTFLRHFELIQRREMLTIREP